MAVNDDPCCCPAQWASTAETQQIGVLILLCRIATALETLVELETAEAEGP